MAVARRAHNSDHWSSSTTAWLNKPTGMAAGDKVLWHGVFSNAAVVVTPPDHGMGMTLVSRVNGTGFCSVVYEGIATGSEPTQIDYAVSIACAHSVGMICYSGAENALVEAQDSDLTASDATPTAGPIESLTDGAMIVAMFGRKLGSSNTADAGWSEGYDHSENTAGLACTSNDVLLATAGPTDDCTITSASAATPHAWHMVAITEEGAVVASSGGASRMAAVGAGS